MSDRSDERDGVEGADDNPDLSNYGEEGAGSEGVVYVYNALPIRDRLLVRRDATPDMVAGGLLHAPDEAKQKPLEGIVLAAGPGRILDNGYHLEMDIKPGQRVVFGKYSGIGVTVNGEDLDILREDEVLLVLEPLS